MNRCSEKTSNIYTDLVHVPLYSLDFLTEKAACMQPTEFNELSGRLFFSPPLGRIATSLQFDITILFFFFFFFLNFTEIVDQMPTPNNDEEIVLQRNRRTKQVGH